MATAHAYLVDSPSPPDNAALERGMPTQTVYVMPIEEGRHSHLIRPIPRIRCLSVSLIVLGVALIIFGLVAIALKTHHSYYSNPIWTGLVFFITTGVLGIFVSKRRSDLKVNIAFLLMSILSIVCAWQLVLFMWMGSAAEYRGCLPSNAYIVIDNNLDICPTATWSRKLVDVILGLLAFSGLAILVVSCSLIIYVTCECCYICCGGDDNSSVTVQYSHHSDIMMSPVHPDPVTTMSDVSDQEAGFVVTTDILQPYSRY